MLNYALTNEAFRLFLRVNRILEAPNLPIMQEDRMCALTDKVYFRYLRRNQLWIDAVNRQRPGVITPLGVNHG
jgi:hypothetical protein